MRGEAGTAGKTWSANGLGVGFRGDRRGLISRRVLHVAPFVLSDAPDCRPAVTVPSSGAAGLSKALSTRGFDTLTTGR